MYNVQIQHKNVNGQSIPINPLTTGKNVSVDTSNANVPDSVKTVGDVIDNLGSLAFANDIEIPDATTSAPGVVTLSSEIDNRTDETKAATEQITKIIEKVTEKVSEASDNMEKSATFVEEQNEMIDNTKSVFDSVIEKTDFLYETIENLSGAIDEILTSNSQITDSITNLSATSEGDFETAFGIAFVLLIIVFVINNTLLF